MSETEMPSWLVRTAQNTILGPFVKEQIVKMIQSRELSWSDEVGESGAYWIFLSEREEVLKQLGIEIPSPDGDEEDTTETAGKVPQRTREIQPPASESISQVAESASGGSIGSAHQVGGQIGPLAGSLTGSTMQKKRVPEIPKLPSMRPVEGPSIWRGMVLVLVGAAAVAVFRVLQLLGSR